MKILASVLLLVLSVWGEDLATEDERYDSQLFQSPVRHGRPGGGGHGRPGGGGHGRPGRPGGPSPSTSSSISLSAGSSVDISSKDFRPYHNGVQTTWNVEATGSNITLECRIWLRRPGCSSSSLTIGEQQFCYGFGGVEPITAQDNIKIVFKARGRRQGFRCTISAEPSAPTNGLDWSYSGSTGPDNWAETYPTCNGSNPSPIDIDTTSALGQFPWKELGLHGYDTAPQAMQLTNSARSAVLATVGPYVMGGNLPLNEQFLFQGVFFHWGPTDASGSEHTIDGKSYAGEAQLVHYNSKYSDFEEALAEDDGVLVLSSFLQISSDDNQELAPVISALKNIQMPGSSTPVEPFPLTNLLPENYDDFYRYEGSQTIPSCEETLTWMIFKNPVDISSSQMAEFRTLFNETGSPITNNVRPTQDLNSRNVTGGQQTPSWSHHGPDGQDVWASEISDSCGGSKQSPINIDTSSTVVESTWAPIVVTNFDQVPDSISFQNNDHGAALTPTMASPATIVGGPFETPYIFFHYHFHFGGPNSNGSEHTIDGRRYPGEIHMLIFNDSLGGFGPAFMTEKGVYEVGIFMELSEDDNPKLDEVISGLENIVPSLATTDVTPFPMENLLPDNLQDFYFYDGAFTAPEPTCSELAFFLIFKEPVTLSRAQFERFYNLENAAGYKIQDNFRDLQPLNGRTVYTPA